MFVTFIQTDKTFSNMCMNELINDYVPTVKSNICIVKLNIKTLPCNVAGGSKPPTTLQIKQCSECLHVWHVPLQCYRPVCGTAQLHMHAHGDASLWGSIKTYLPNFSKEVEPNLVNLKKTNTPPHEKFLSLNIKVVLSVLL